MLNNLAVDNSGENTGVIVGTNSGTINLLEHVVKIPSLISVIVKKIGTFCYSDIDEESSACTLIPFKPEEKLDYNRVIKYKEIIYQYSTYYENCEQALNIYDNSHIGSKAKILNSVKLWYCKSKGTLLLELKDSKLSDIEKIRNNSDRLIDEVIDQIQCAINGSKDFSDTYFEELDLGIICFVCYCFMKCKILERPI
ncbi:hypothetical protein [Faecalispora jeddahensis]|uniref:hypothetical protein n=1 Tax=Faecalispora jeddahensis TaxID=1414721 RepID=UPI001FAC923D|nr:hypothetical protein [Faecalispora jeddahensis]